MTTVNLFFKKNKFLYYNKFLFFKNKNIKKIQAFRKMFSEISGVDGMGDGDIAIVIMTLVALFIRLRSQ